MATHTIDIVQVFDWLYDITKQEYKNPTLDGTYYFPLRTVEQDGKDYDFALVVGWREYCYSPKETLHDLCGKIAFQSSNSCMFEYDIDWTMPANEDGEVWDTECSLSDFKENDVKMMIKTADWFVKNYLAILEAVEKGELKLIW